MGKEQIRRLQCDDAAQNVKPIWDLFRYNSISSYNFTSTPTEPLFLRQTVPAGQNRPISSPTQP
jgi:hypothetical protein